MTLSLGCLCLYLSTLFLSLASIVCHDTHSLLCTYYFSCLMFHWQNPNHGSSCCLPPFLLPEKHKIIVKIKSINLRWGHAHFVSKTWIITKLCYPGIEVGLLPKGKREFIDLTKNIISLLTLKCSYFCIIYHLTFKLLIWPHISYYFYLNCI